MNGAKKILYVIFSVLILIETTPTCAFAAQNNDYAQYSGATVSNGYNVNCTFTITKIVNNRFRGAFSATGIGQYSFNENSSGLVNQ